MSHTTVKSTLPPSNVRLSNPQHVDGSLVQLDEHAVEDLAKTEELEDFADLGADSVDTGSTRQKELRLHSILLHRTQVTAEWFQINWLIFQFSFTIVDKMGKKDSASLTTKQSYLALD